MFVTKAAEIAQKNPQNENASEHLQETKKQWTELALRMRDFVDSKTDVINLVTAYRKPQYLYLGDMNFSFWSFGGIFVFLGDIVHREASNSEAAIKTLNGKNLAKSANTTLFCAKRMNALALQISKQSKDPTFQIKINEVLKVLQFGNKYSVLTPQ